MNQSNATFSHGDSVCFNSIDELKHNDNLKKGSIISVLGVVNSRYKVMAMVIPKVGDIRLKGNNIAVLLPTELGYSVTAFGDSSNIAEHQNMFESASKRALLEARKATELETFGQVYVPQRPDGGSWKLKHAVTQQAIWNIGVGSEQQNPPNYYKNNMDNLSYLTGKVSKLNGRGESLLVLGASDLNWIQDIDGEGRILGNATATAVSGSGTQAFFGAVRTSDNPKATEGCIGYKAYALNDRTENPGVSYCSYMEALQHDNAGTTIVMETNPTPNRKLKKVYPNDNVGNQFGACFNYLIGGPVRRKTHNGGSSSDNYEDNTNSASCGVLVSGGSARTKSGKLWGFDSVMVVLHNAMQTSIEREVFRLPTDTKISYYSTSGKRSGYTSCGQDGNANGQYVIAVNNRNNVVSGLRVTGSDWRPVVPNSTSLGSPSFKMLDGYFVNTPIGNSDSNLKTDQTKISDKLMKAALAVDPLIWKWKSAVEAKGEKARWHAGPIAQQVQSSFEAQNIDPFEFGFIGYDEIEEEYTEEVITKGESGEDLTEEITKTRKTGETVMNLRPVELLWLISSAHKKKQEELEHRLNKIEAKF